jgi:hypothetical protein
MGIAHSGLSLSWQTMLDIGWVTQLVIPVTGDIGGYAGHK